MNNLQKYIKEKGIMKKALAEHLGVSSLTMRRYIKDPGEMRNNQLVKLAKFLKVSLLFLLDMDDEDE